MFEIIYLLIIVVWGLPLKIDWYELSKNQHFETQVKLFWQFFETLFGYVDFYFFEEKKQEQVS